MMASKNWIKSGLFEGALMLSLWVLVSVSSVKAQNASDALRYSLRYQATGLEVMAFPGSAMTMKSVSASSFYNPAALALYDESLIRIGVDYNRDHTDGGYLTNSQATKSDWIGLGELGGVYSFPTERGSLVIGIGYSRTATYEREVEFSGFNTEHTITDFFNTSSFYGDIAYNAFAIDSVGTGTQSILRQQPGSFQGIQQEISRVEEGTQAYYSFTFATEFKRNLFVGASVNIIGGDYDYQRSFEEVDPNDIYNGSGATTDFLSMQSIDNISTVYSGVSINMGLLFTPMEEFRIGLGYQIPTRLEVEETYSSAIQTRFDNGDQFSDELDGNQTYKVKYPARLNAGIYFKLFSLIEATGQAEYVDYSTTGLEDLGDPFYQDGENNYIESAYTSIWNLSGGLGFDLGMARISGGVSYYPSAYTEDPQAIGDRWVYSGGISYQFDQDITLYASGSWTQWEQTSVEYQFFNTDTNAWNNATSREDIDALQILLGISIAI
ncbi:MAG: OmpP1/FadL family transporter [Bacteroidota bacterium]